MSPIALNLGRPAAADVPARSGGLRIPLSIGGGALAAPLREAPALRAVAAAVAIARPAESLTLARRAIDNLGEVLTENGLDEVHLKPVLDEIARIQGNRAAAPAATDVQRSVANAVGADAALVAAAFGKLDETVDGNDEAGRAARYWVAQADAALLDKAARAAARRQQLALITPATPAPKQLEERIDALDRKVTEGVAALDARLKKLENSVS